MSESMGDREPRADTDRANTAPASYGAEGLKPIAPVAHPSLVERLRQHLVMSKFASQQDLHEAQVRLRMEAADRIEQLERTSDTIVNALKSIAPNASDPIEALAICAGLKELFQDACDDDDALENYLVSEGAFAGDSYGMPSTLTMAKEVIEKLKVGHPRRKAKAIRRRVDDETLRAGHAPQVLTPSKRIDLSIEIGIVMSERFVIEGEWSGYTSSQQRIVHRKVYPGHRKQLRKWAETARAIQYDDGTLLHISVRDCKPRERVKEILGYTSLIEDCAYHNVATVRELQDFKKAGALSKAKPK